MFAYKNSNTSTDNRILRVVVSKYKSYKTTSIDNMKHWPILYSISLQPSRTIHNPWPQNDYHISPYHCETKEVVHALAEPFIHHKLQIAMLHKIIEGINSILKIEAASTHSHLIIANSPSLLKFTVRAIPWYSIDYTRPIRQGNM